MDITLQPACLRWARIRAGLSTAELAKKMVLKEARIIAWEQSGEISMYHAEKLADKTHTPLGYLFLPTPPTISLPITDFRTHLTTEIPEPSVDLLEIINQALEVQDWYRDYLLGVDEEAREYVGRLTVSNDRRDIVASAEYMRNAIGWGSINDRTSSSWSVAFERYIEAAENAGVLLIQCGHVPPNTRRILKTSEFRGFALSDRYAPLIFININDFDAAQMFTLAHELVHIGLGESGVSDINPAHSRNLATEQFCNAVAAEMLVPLRELRALQRTVEPSTDFIAYATRYFKVSSLVILRRLNDASLISDDEFRVRYFDELNEFRDKKSKGSGGGNWYNNVRGRLGDRFVRALISSTLSGQTTYRDAGRLLGSSKSESLHQLAKQVGVLT